MTNVCILGMPGLYQNWLMSALDPSSECIESSDSNFLSKPKTLRWVRKFDANVEQVRKQYPIVINTYVKDETLYGTFIIFWKKLMTSESKLTT